MTELTNNIKCCGIYELNGVSRTTPEDIITNMLADWDTDDDDAPDMPYVFFSDIAGNKKAAFSGWKLAAYIKTKKLGVVKTVAAKGIKNPNSGNVLTMWVWTPNWSRVLKAVPCSKCGK